MKKAIFFTFALFQIIGLLAQPIDNESVSNHSKGVDCQESKENILMHTGTVTTSSANFYDSGGVEGTYQGNEFYTLTLFPATEGTRIMVTFSAFNCEKNYDFLQVYNGVSSSSPKLATLTGQQAPVEPFIANNPQGALTFVFTSDGSVNKAGWSAIVSCFVMYDYNLAAVQLLGAPFAAVSAGQEIEVVVKNLGTNAADGTNYNVNIVDENNVVLGSTLGVTLASFEQSSVIVEYTATSEGALQIKGVVDFSVDQDLLNNETSLTAITVMSPETHIAQVGTANVLPPVWIPFDFYSHNNSSQTIYSSSELGIHGGTLNALSYHAQFESDACSGRHVKIWIGETMQSDLLEGWIDPANLTLVFDGSISIPSGESTVVIPFDESYNYSGNNLVVYTYRVHEHNYCRDMGRFYGTEFPNSNRTFRAGSDNEFDPVNPIAGTAIHWVPNTTFFFSSIGLGGITGNVTSQGLPVQDVHVNVVGTTTNETTNASGFYHIPFLNAGVYSFEFSKIGFQPSIVSDVLLVGNDTALVDVVLTPIPQYMVSGIITASNTNLGLEGATVRLNGYSSYSVMTNVNGEFVFPAVWNGVYNITITLHGFHVFEVNNITINNQNISFSAQLIEEIVQPYNLMAEQQGSSILFSWNNDPGFSDDMESYDDFEYQTIGDYTLVDVDGQPTYPITQFDFPNEEYTGSFMVFNPTTTNPAASSEWVAHSGTKYLACWASTATPNNDWLILPQTSVMPGMEFSFWARTSPPGPYSMDRFKVAVSTTGTNPTDFHFISPGSYVQPPHIWTPYSYDLSAYAGQTVYVAIQCVSTDCQALLIDDIFLGVPRNNSKSFLGYTVYLDGEEVASGLQTPSYLFAEILPISHTFGVKSVYTTGESEISYLYVSISNFLVTFVAKNSEDNTPIPGIQIDINEQSIITNEQGEASIVLSMGEYDYVLLYNGVEYETGNVYAGQDNIIVNIQGPVAIEYRISDEFSIFPNPVSNILNLTRNESSRALVEIYSNKGMLIEKFEITEAQIEKGVVDYTSGVYIIRITNSETTTIQQFIKK